MLPSTDTGENPFLDLSPTLALELASGLTSPSDIFQRHGIEPQQAVLILRDKTFQRMLISLKAEWDGDENTEERIRRKSRLALEELLPTHYALATSPAVPAAARNEAVKIFKSLGGMDRKEEGAAEVKGFAITINLGDKPEEQIVIEADE